ncbi:MAG: hypothetical protein ACREBS_07745, partial [Nitrososphaerales archaeon]
AHACSWNSPRSSRGDHFWICSAEIEEKHLTIFFPMLQTHSKKGQLYGLELWKQSKNARR